MRCMAPCMVWLVLVFGGGSTYGQTSNLKPASKDRKSIQRAPWTTSRIHGAPTPPPPLKAALAFPHLKFSRPTVLTNAPGTARLFVTEQGGKVYSFSPQRDAKKLDLVIDLKNVYKAASAVYGLTFHPQFEQNRFVYICYVVGENKKDGTRVSRFTVDRGDPPQIDPQTEQIIITWLSGGHNGGCLKFGPDGCLYISTGDGAGPSPPDTLRAGQDVSNLLSAILRIDVDHHDAGKAYRIPPDNPLVNIEGACGEIWAYGFRNPWKMSFDRVSGDLWVGDVGWELWEMIYRIQKGGNYGWSIVEGRQPVLPQQEAGPTPILPPTIDHPHSEAASITGGFVYRGRRLPSLIGAYIYGDFQSGIVWGARLKEDKVDSVTELAQTSLQLVGFAEDNAGELYLLDYLGQIYELVKNPQKDRSRDFPHRLSETGLFSSTPKHEMAAGVIAYSINAEHWADHTHAQRYFAVPGRQRIQVGDRGNWQFPDGSVIVKTVSLEIERGNPRSRRRLETQILHREEKSWRPYTYVWNEQQTEALLAAENGLEQKFKVRDPHVPGGAGEQTYRIAGRKECVLCHNPWVEAKTTIFGVQSASLLGVSIEQLNRSSQGPIGVENQLHLLQNLGLLDKKLPKQWQAKRFADPYDESAEIEKRVRAYLHVNCQHCHQFNAGGAATIVLSHDVNLKETRTIDVRPTQGAFGISDARIIAPGDPLGSVLYYRMAKLGGGRMPRVGSTEVDERAVKLIHDWIESLSPPNDSAGENEAAKKPILAAVDVLRRKTSGQTHLNAIRQLTNSTRGALALLELLDGGEAAGSIRREVIAHTKAHPAAEVRDLFEKFLPASERVKRLGTVVNPADILRLDSDAQRGKQIFFDNSAASCKSCHRVGGVGQPLGPDLDQVGKKYTRSQLLEHILTPSKFIEPKYIPYLLETAQGKILTGLVEKKTDDQVVLRDAKNQIHRFTADEIELLVRQQKSLMPELLLRDMTPQQVADLLAYLASLK